MASSESVNLLLTVSSTVPMFLAKTSRMISLLFGAFDLVPLYTSHRWLQSTKAIFIESDVSHEMFLTRPSIKEKF